MSRYIPVRFYPDRMPIDISFVFENEKPAGKHGFCQVDGDKFRFEDGTPVKFWGVIFNGACCFPDHAYAEKVAQRLAQAGCNVVRFHQLDAEWATPNIFRLTAGKRLKDTRHFDPVCMERHDYLIKCLRDQGIYICTDITTFRKYKSGDGVREADRLSDNIKAISLYDPTIIELQKEYAYNYWNHYNPYTGLCYKDDPTFVLVDIINENDMFTTWKTDSYENFYYNNMFRDMFNEWLKEQGIEYDAYGCEMFNTDKPMIDFRVHLSTKYYEGMHKYLHEEVGIKVPICGTNWVKRGGLVKSQENLDFQDSHHYYYDWKWGEYEKITANASIFDTKISRLGGVCASRIHGQPMFMTEWDMPWPNSYRAESPIWFPAVALLQGWSGMIIHTYAYGTNLKETDVLGKEATSSTIGSVPYREGIFTCWNDPSKFGLFYHGALMTRLGHVHEAKKTIGAKMTDMGANLRDVSKAALCYTGMEVHRIDTVFDTTDTSDLDDIRPIEEALPREDPNRFESDTGELWRDNSKRIGAVDTASTKAAYGFLSSAKPTSVAPDAGIILNGMKIKCNTDFATIALSSLTEEPIENSDCMLLSTVGRSRTRGAQFDGEKLLDFGTGPIEVEVIDAEIAIKTNVPDLRVWSVNSDGYYIGQLEKTYEDGWLKFHVGPHYAGMYYLIMQE